ncbi:hypothetical protein AMTR_s00017p00134050 [Amborella trichopoda]|uniref:Prolamin-like domain-containing protein n=1 Tax=Amborella trichopoda TaxID=13333 RepID=W1PF16_AMBTC|nr:hypothetical protein AMTR_s00017p00134050 [Amborella trichopoda]
MSSKLIHAVSLIIVAISAITEPVLAQVQSGTQKSGKSTTGGFLWDLHVAGSCWEQVSGFFTTGTNPPGIDCCKTLLEVEEQRWASFSWPQGIDSSLILLLNTHCLLLVARTTRTREVGLDLP